MALIPCTRRPAKPKNSRTFTGGKHPSPLLGASTATGRCRQGGDPQRYDTCVGSPLQDAGQSMRMQSMSWHTPGNYDVWPDGNNVLGSPLPTRHNVPRMAVQVGSKYECPPNRRPQVPPAQESCCGTFVGWMSEVKGQVLRAYANAAALFVRTHHTIHTRTHRPTCTQSRTVKHTLRAGGVMSTPCRQQRARAAPRAAGGAVPTGWTTRAPPFPTRAGSG